MSSPHTDRVRVRELEFVPLLSAEQIQRRVSELGRELRQRLGGASNPTFLVMLNGAFIFAADLVRASELSGEMCFVRTRSYAGTRTTREVELLLAPEPALVRDADVVVIEDIIDSGLTMQAFLPRLRELGPRSVTVVTLLHKPDVQEVELPIDLVGFAIPPHFVVGYGLDYNGRGRHLPAIYQLAQDY